MRLASHPYGPDKRCVCVSLDRCIFSHQNMKTANNQSNLVQALLTFVVIIERLIIYVNCHVWKQISVNL